MRPIALKLLSGMRYSNRSFILDLHRLLHFDKRYLNIKYGS